MDYSLQDTTSDNYDLTIIVNHHQFNRQPAIDEILHQLGIYENHLIAAAMHSLMYSTPVGLLGEWYSNYFDELWEYAVPASVYEFGSDFEKMLAYNEHTILDYAKWLFLQYQNYLFSSMHGYADFYNHVAKQRGYVFLGTNFSLITFGNISNEYFTRYSSISSSPIPIEQPSRFKLANPVDPTTLPYYIVGKGR